VSDWCFWSFGHQGCKEEYRVALQSAEEWGRRALLLCSGLSSLNFALVVVCLRITRRIVTPVVIMKYMSTKVNLMLILPGLANIFVGADLTGASEFDEEVTAGETDFRKISRNIILVGRIFVSAGCFILGTMLVGFDTDRLKHKWVLRSYMGGLAVAAVLLAIAAAWTAAISVNIRDDLDSNNWKRGAFACKANLYGCSNCHYQSQGVGEEVDYCPEWPRKDIVRYVQVYLRVAGLEAVTSLIYVTAAIRFAAALAKTLREYRCEYI